MALSFVVGSSRADVRAFSIAFLSNIHYAKHSSGRGERSARASKHTSTMAAVE